MSLDDVTIKLIPIGKKKKKKTQIILDMLFQSNSGKHFT